MDRILRPCLGVFAMLSLVTGVAYPLFVTGVSRLVFPTQSVGSVIEHEGRAAGSALLGQPFASRSYFWSRPSATAPQPYNGAASTGTNQAPGNPALAVAIAARVAALRAADPGNTAPIPVDLVTASASGLDPHISVAAAEYQVARVAAARRMPADRVHELVAMHTDGRVLGVLGEPRVNVLKLNLALDGAR